jgi:Icc protein
MVSLSEEYVGILGDPACRPGWQAHFPRVAELLWNTYRPSHVFVPGDVTANGMAAQPEEIRSHCRRHTWDWVVAMGDHDRPLDIFKRYWGPPHKVTDLGLWRFIGVDTSEGLFTEQEALWLRAQIKDHSVIYMHMPPRMESWEFHSLCLACTARFLGILDDFRDRVWACFFGHIHSYDRKEYRGIPLVVTGAGGAEALGLGSNGYQGTRPFQAMAFSRKSGEIYLVEDVREQY